MAAIIAGVITLPPGGPSPSAVERPGVPPEDPWTCPATHPIKGYVSRESGRHVYFLPGGRFYEEASPERCYASEDEARRDGSRPAREREPSMPGDLAQHAVRDVCRQSAG